MKNKLDAAVVSNARVYATGRQTEFHQIFKSISIDEKLLACKLSLNSMCFISKRILVLCIAKS